MIHARGLSAGYDKVMVLNNVDISVQKGEIVSVIGRNGIGKSTLMKTLMGILKAASGSIVLDGLDVTRKKSFERARMGIAYVPQGHVVFPRLTVEENLMMGENIKPQKGKKADFNVVYSYFPRLAERKNQLAGTMSGGEQAMLSIGRVLTGNPALMLLDEPSEGVQPNVVQQIGGIVQKINKELGLTVLLVEQHIGLIQSISQRCYAMDKGAVADILDRDALLDYERVKVYLSV